MDKKGEKDKAARSLYDEALDRFRRDAAERSAGSKDADILAEFLRDRATPEETKLAAQELRGDAGKKYGSRKLGDVEIPASWIANIMNNIDNFVTVGNYLTKNSPESVGMAWYAVRLTLSAIHTNYDLYTFFGSGLSDISEIMIIVRHYDRLYDERSKPDWKPSPLVEKLFQDVIGAYAAVLDFSFAVKCHLTAGALTRIKHGFKDFFGISKAKFESKLGTVASLKRKILEESQGAFQDKTLTQLESVSTVLVGIEGTVRNIQDFQETQQKLHEDAMAKFDVLIKGLDDIKASTKRKTQWDYAVQDFQAFQDDLNPLQGSFGVLGDNIDAIYPGTCQWLFEEPLYKKWSESATNALLCVAGPEGSGKSFLLASVADRITRAAAADKVMLYVTCSADGINTAQAYTADSICRTFLSQLYDLAVQGEDNVGLLETCNAIFKKAKEKIMGLPNHMRGDDNSGLPEFSDAFSKIAILLKKSVVLILDGLDANSLDDKNQEQLVKKLQGLMGAIPNGSGINIQILVACPPATKFFSELDLTPESWIDVEGNNRQDMGLFLANALKDVPGLSAAEQEAAKAAILEKARSRFVYVRDTAIPFMLEPFQRPLSRRLEALPDGASDTFTKALTKMSANYLDLLRTALTWTLLCPEYPGLPFAREIMDAFQGTYDVPPESDYSDEGAGFSLTSRLEVEQLRGATDPFLKLFPIDDGRIWVTESDAAAVAEFFLKDDEEVHEEQETHDEEHLCAKCASVITAVKPLHVSRKEGHLQMALTCLRHLNHPLFQRRAGLFPGADDTEEVTGAEPAEEGAPASGEAGSEVGEDSPEEESADADKPGDEQQDDEDEARANYLLEAEEEYHSEDSLDDEDVTEIPWYDKLDTHKNRPDDDDEEDWSRLRYEIQYWPWHIRRAQEQWPEEERQNSSEWAALMAELDKLAFDTPRLFAAWQAAYPDKENEYGIFNLAKVPHKPLHVAAYLGLTSWVSHLLERGEELNGLSEGFSPLQAAACTRTKAIHTMKQLLDAGADLNAENGAGRTAFQLWFLTGEITVDSLRLFLEHKGDPAVFNSGEHYSAIYYFAIRGEDPEALDLLMAHGADINAVHPKDLLQMPPLHMLLVRRDVPKPLLRAFIKHGADTNAESAQSVRPLQIVCNSGRLDILEVLLESEVLDIDDPDHQGTTAVHEAAFYGYSDLIQLMLDHGADPDIPDKLNRIALHTAARKGFVDTVRLLLKHSKPVNMLDKQNWTPLMCACIGKDQDAALLILDALIERNLPLAEIIQPSRSRRTVLRQAADHGFDKVVSKLVQLAADRNDAASLAIDARDTKKGMTALHRAARNGHAACVAALLSSPTSSSSTTTIPPADASLPDSQGRTALMLAYDQWSVNTKKTAYEEILSLLIAANPAAATSDADLVAVCAANGSVKLLTQLWRLNAPLNRPDRFGWTPLDLASRFARTEALQFLKQQAAWANLLPSRWGEGFPSTTPVGAASIVGSAHAPSYGGGDEEYDAEGNVVPQQPVLPPGRRIVHLSGKRTCVSADRPLPAGLEGYYFEVTLEDRPGGARASFEEFPEMAVGFCTLGGAALEFPGWPAVSDSPSTARSWGYHADTGWVYSSAMASDDPEAEGTAEGLRYRVGDTVGAGVDLGKGEIWFTRNGVRLERVVKGVEGRLFPVVGLHEGVCFWTNFGREGDPAFKWQPGAGGEEKKEGGDGTVVQLVVRDGKGNGGEEKKVATQVTTEAVVVDVKA